MPRASGGHEADLRTQVEVLAELGRGCASTAWVVGLDAANKAGARLMLPDVAQEAVLADPDAVFCATQAVSPGSSGAPVPSGLRVTGRWAMATGSELASLAMITVPMPDAPAPAVCLVPLSDLQVDRTWRAAGLGGTSSHSLVAEDVFVPEEYITFPDAFRPPAPESLFGGGLTALAPMIGTSRAALDLVAAAIAGGRAPFMTTYARVADSPLGRYWFTEARQRVDAAMRRAIRVAETIDARPADNGLPLNERMELRVELSTAARECREALELLLDLHGASGFANDNPLQRLWRDVAVGTRHPFFTPYILAEDEGRLAFDVLPTASVML